jgi:cytochrome c-type biogenesis protein
LLASTASRVPVAFAVGFISIVLPCVLPLVPGYLSAVSAVEAGRLGERGVGRRVALASVPFIIGFTVVFVLLGAGAAAIGSVLNKRLQLEFAGFLLIVVGLGFVGLLPWPERAVAPGLLARARGSSILLGAAFAVCAAPCIGAVLGSILALAASSGTVLRGVVLLAAYSIGLGAAFMLAGVAFTRAMSAFRWVRNRYIVLQLAGGAVLIALGLLLFFDRSWWLNVAVNRILEKVGLDQI